LNEFTNGQNATIFFFKLFEQYSHFLKRAELGSRFMEIRSISEERLKNVTGHTSDHSVKADVSAAFEKTSVNAAAGYGDGKSEKDKFDTLNKYSQTFRTTTGEDPDFISMTFSVAANPGVLDADLAPICDIIPTHQSELQEKCFDFLKAKHFCFSALPGIRVVDESSLKTVEEHSIQMRTHPRCEHLPPIIINAHFIPGDGITQHIARVVDLRECILRALRDNAIGISFRTLIHSGVTYCQIARHERSLNKMEKCDSNSCFTLLFDWPSDSSIPILKKALPSGEFIELHSGQGKWHREGLACQLKDFAKRMAADNGSISYDGELSSWNRAIMLTILSQTFQDECEERCKVTPECNYVHKVLRLHWDTFGLDEFYQVDPNAPHNGPYCGGSPKVSLRCSFFISVYSMRALPDKALDTNQLYGKMITSVLIRASTHQGTYFCFSALPDIRLVNEYSLKTVENHSIQMRRHPRCEHLPPIIVNAHFIHGRSTSEHTGIDLRQCINMGFDSNAIGISFGTLMNSGVTYCQIAMDDQYSLKKMEKCDSNSCFTLLFHWPSGKLIPILKNSLLTGESGRSKSVVREWNEENQACNMTRIVQGLSYNNGSVSQDEFDYLNEVFLTTLVQTYQDECELTCKVTQECNYVYKHLKMQWFTFGLDANHQIDPNSKYKDTKCGGSPRVIVRCIFYVSVSSVRITTHRTTDTNQLYGQMFTSALINPSNRTKRETNSNLIPKPEN
jgi:hypothetical protein